MIPPVSNGANMAGTYSQLNIQIVFAGKGRQNLLQKPRRAKVFRYISKIIKKKGHKPIMFMFLLA
jgi:putative transposase